MHEVFVSDYCNRKKVGALSVEANGDVHERLSLLLTQVSSVNKSRNDVTCAEEPQI